MAALTSYPWLGNIRELQNLIERAVILANDEVLPNPLPSPGLPTVTSPTASTTLSDSTPEFPRTLKESERALILQTLNATGWVIGGSNGAATILGLKRTTLIDKMKKLGIRRPTRRADSSDAFMVRRRPGSPA